MRWGGCRTAQGLLQCWCAFVTLLYFPTSQPTSCAPATQDCSLFPQTTHTQTLEYPLEFRGHSSVVPVMGPGENQWFAKFLSIEACVLLFFLFPRCGTLPSPLEKTHQSLKSQTKCHDWKICRDLCSLPKEGTQNGSPFCVPSLGRITHSTFPLPLGLMAALSVCLAGP